MPATLGAGRPDRFSVPARSLRSASALATQAGTVAAARGRGPGRRSGVSPTSSVNRALNEPSEVQPTAMQTSVTDRSPRRSSALARSIRRVIR